VKEKKGEKIKLKSGEVGVFFFLPGAPLKTDTSQPVLAPQITRNGKKHLSLVGSPFDFPPFNGTL
jgi:hypothetical protein